MRLLTTRENILNVAKRWDKAYGPSKNRTVNYGKDKIDILQKLFDIDKETATAEQIDNIIGNSSWTKNPDCSECGNSEDPMLLVGQEQDYESETVYLCRSCAIKVADMFK